MRVQRETVAVPHRRGFASTLRVDAWRLEPTLFLVGLTVLFGYLAVSAFLNNWAFKIGPHLSPDAVEVALC